MSEPRTLRRPVRHFEVAVRSDHVTFDDGQSMRRSLPWGDFAEARWSYADPTVIHLDIGPWLVELQGRNLAPLFAAIEERTLLRVRAQPELDDRAENLPDTFVTMIQFLKPAVQPVGRSRARLEVGPARKYR